MPINYYMWFVAALIPMVIGAIYYHEKVFGTAWMKANGFSKEHVASGNMAVILGVSYLFSLFLAVTLTGIVIHQNGAFQMMMPPAGAEMSNETKEAFMELMGQYGGNFRTFGHGVLHGVLAAIMFALPILGINALFERRGWKYILIHAGYWVITLALMGGLLCATLEYAPLI